MNKQIIFLAGLPRSGSTLLCNILAQHPQISSTVSSSLSHIIAGAREKWSNDSFQMAEMEYNFDECYDRLKNATLAFIQGWHFNFPTPIIINKNRNWLFLVEILEELDPNFKMIVTLRDLRSIFASTEVHNKKTILIKSGENTDMRDERASNLFSNGGVIGSPLIAIRNLDDIFPYKYHNNLYRWRYEDYMKNPIDNIKRLFKWIGVDPIDIDLQNIKQVTHEADSFYHFKFPHKIKSSISKSESEHHQISPRIEQQILKQFEWFYQLHYPEVLLGNNQNNIPNNLNAPNINQNQGKSMNNKRHPFDDIKLASENTINITNDIDAKDVDELIQNELNQIKSKTIE